MDLDLSILSDDQLVALFRAVIKEASLRQPAVQAAVKAAGLDEAEKGRIAAAAAAREAEKLAREEAERIAREAAEKVRLEKELAERKASTEKTKRLWDRKTSDAKRLKGILPHDLPSGNRQDYVICVWNKNEKRVYVRRAQDGFGRNCIEYYLEGNSRNKPDSIACSDRVVSEAAEKRSVPESQIRDELKSWCRDLCAFWNSCEFNTSEVED